MEVYVGTSGYSYEDWVGPYYPPGTPKNRFLEVYARDFGCCEVNYTYYTMPSAQTLAAMLRKTHAGFRFAVKAHGSMTHEREQADNETFAAYRRALEPLLADGNLACVLAQFPPSLRPTPAAWERLKRFRELLADVPLVMEFRHASWAQEETFDFMREREIGYCCVDEPHFESLMPPTALATSSLGYVRLHGRNYEKWWRHEQAWERYNYLYSPEELSEWLPRMTSLSEQGAQETYVFFNNHYKAQAVRNAQALEAMLREADID